MYTVSSSSLRIRDQTTKVERHANAAWRARTNESRTRYSNATVSSGALLWPIPADIDTLALHRFLYDFSESKTSLSAISLQDFSSPASDGVNPAFLATSLANFNSRHRDQRAAIRASKALSQALVHFRRTLQSAPCHITQDLVLTAILLGLHQVRSRRPSASND